MRRLFSEIREGLFISFEAIRSNRMRSLLTTLGIIIGIVTVTLMAAAIAGVRVAFVNSISAIGGDVLYVTRRSWLNDSHQQWIKERNRPRLSYAQARQLQKQLPSAAAIAPMAISGCQVKYKNRSSSFVQLIGTTEDYLLASGISIAKGRFLSPGEVEGGRPVCVIGWDVSTNLFGLESPLGNRIRLGPSAFEVVGVVEKRGSVLGMASLDTQVVIPIQQFIGTFWDNPDCTIQVKVANLARLDEAREELRGAMRKVRRLAPTVPDDFAINQQEQFLQIFDRVTGTIAMVGLCITSLSLFVGGIGIMNIMFVSVTERTREIGIRKAIGAKRRAILIQFLIEAASICLLGGFIGLLIAWLLTIPISSVLPMGISFPVAAMALSVATVTGLISGFFPAWRAARLDPVEALRSE